MTSPLSRRFLLVAALIIAGSSLARAAILDEEEDLLFGEPPEQEEASLLPESVFTTQPGIRVTDSAAPAAPVAPPVAPPAGDPMTMARQWRIRGDMLVATNRMDEAAQAYWQAARTNPRNVGYLHYFGFALLALGDHANGRDVYLEILRRYPGARKVLFNLASAHYGLKDYEQALKYLDDYLATRPRENPKALVNLGLIYLALDRAADAIPRLERAQERLPANPFIPAALVRAYRAAGKNDLADHTQGLSEDRFGAEYFQQLLAAEVPPVFLDR